MNITKVAIFGLGKLGNVVLCELSKRDDITFYNHQFIEGENYHLVLPSTDVCVDVVDSSILNTLDEQRNFIKDVDVIVVTVTGKVLEKEIDFLLGFRIPLVICSTNYDVELIKQKAADACVSVLISDNFALPILDFWQRIQSLKELPLGLTPRLHVIESHQSFKKDFSGSAIKAMLFFLNRGFQVDMPDEKDYKNGQISSSGSLVSIRSKSESLKLVVPEQFLDSHAYHRFFIHFDTQGIDENIEYVEYFLQHFKSLEESSISGVLDFQVNLLKNGVEIIHNINGLGIYSIGIVKAVKFIDMNKGEYTGLDLLGF